MYRVYIGIFFAIVFASSGNACWISDRKGELPGYCPASEFRYEHLEGYCYVICDTCAHMIKFDITVEGHAHLCPQRGGSCLVGTANCCGTSTTIDHPSSDIFPCVRTCVECKKTSENAENHFPECPHYGSSEKPDEGGDGGENNPEDDSGNDTPEGGGDGDDLNVPNLDSFVSDEIELPTLDKDPMITYDGFSGGDWSLLPHFHFLDQEIGKTPPSFEIPLGFCNLFIDFNDPVLYNSVVYVRNFEIVCITISSFYYIVYLLRSFET